MDSRPLQGHIRIENFVPGHIVGLPFALVAPGVGRSVKSIIGAASLADEGTRSQTSSTDADNEAQEVGVQPLGARRRGEGTGLRAEGLRSAD